MAFGDLADVLGAINLNVEDSDAAVSAAWPTCGEVGHQLGSEVSSSVSGVISARQAVPNDPDGANPSSLYQ